MTQHSAPVRFFRTLTRALPSLLAAALLAGASSAAAADAQHPTVVELFQSQGCSSCPPANANVLAIATRPEVLALSWQVTYWDDLGWKDTFGKPAFTARQWQYARAFHRLDVATPEVVVNGRADVVGASRGELEALIQRADRGDAGPAIQLAPGRASIDGRGAGVVLLVRYDPNIVMVPIQRGENGGRTLPHKNVVREVVDLGQWTGGARSFPLPAPSRPGLRTAILVQQGPGGPILAASHD
jgi:hypothetical protein